MCAACDRTGCKITKEHLWQKWLIRRTGTHKTSVRLDEKRRVNPLALTVPLCEQCNHDFGRELEGPVSRIFDDLERGSGISDIEAELLIRWLWRFEGLAWILTHSEDVYTERYTLRQRVLQPIDEIRSDLTLAIGLAARIEPEFGDAPMGIDSMTEVSAIFVAGVFSRVAIMVLLQKFEKDAPENFSLYHLADVGNPSRSAKLFHPKTGFSSCVEAVNITQFHALQLSYAHDVDARNHERALSE